MMKIEKWITKAKVWKFKIQAINLCIDISIACNWNTYMFSDFQVCSRSCSVHDDVIKWKHFPRNWPFVREIHRSPVNFPHKGQWRGALMFSLIYAWINDWVNNREAGDLRRQPGHYDVIVMWHYICIVIQVRVSWFIDPFLFNKSCFIFYPMDHLSIFVDYRLKDKTRMFNRNDDGDS